MKNKFVSLLLCLMSLVSAGAFANESVGPFQISKIYVSNGNNMHFRPVGGTTTICPASPNWAYLNDTDSGASGKISSLLAAYAAKKNVTLIVEPINFYSNGSLYCHIIELLVSD